MVGQVVGLGSTSAGCTLFLPPDVGHCTGSMLVRWFLVVRSPVTASTMCVICGQRMQTHTVWLALALCRAGMSAATPPHMVWQLGMPGVY